MKNFLIVATIAIGMLASCNKKANNETESAEVQPSETTEQVQVITDTTNQVSTDSINQVEKDKVDAAHGHTH
jgi:protein involved in sex pheromone biosynthesis